MLWSSFFAPVIKLNIFKAYPVYDWQTADIWTGPKKFNWDYNTAYDVMEKIGMTHSAQRCAPPFGEEPLQGLWTFAQCFPDIWDKMCYRVKGANTAARHALSVLYSNRKQPEKPEFAAECWPRWFSISS